MAGRKVKILEGEIGQLKTDFEEKISDFHNQFATIQENMDGRFVALEDLMKKMFEDKQKPTTSESKVTTGSHGRGGNPNPFRGMENPEVEVLEGDDGMPHIEPLSREEMSMGYDRRGADFVGRREEFHRRGADFEGRRGKYDEGFGFLCFPTGYCCFPAVNNSNFAVGSSIWMMIACKLKYYPRVTCELKYFLSHCPLYYLLHPT
ncbi:hypothetical protein M5K25_022238 [Dendrobium thyrsiflorum]|uniref:Uncharacterized protein n=1 Tax=Dendrobium thyrsiflorum TaxID=117978 RepID=A0ABD0U5U9_DENTH